MRRIVETGLCLTALLAVAALGTSSALAAEPSGEFGFCKAKANGKYSNNGCTKPVGSKGKFEWESLTSPVHLTGEMKAGTLATLETEKGTKVICKKEHNTGEIATAHEVANVVATFEECESSKFPCESAGQKEGTIVTHPLSGGTGVEKLGTKGPATNKMAEELHGPGHGSLAEFACAGLPIVVRGSVLHPVTSNKMLTTTTEKFAATKGEQKPECYVPCTKDEHILESSTAGGAFEESGQTITATVKFSTAVELNSTL